MSLERLAGDLCPMATMFRGEPGRSMVSDTAFSTRREFSRVHVRLQAMLEPEKSSSAVEGRVDNLSMKGGFFLVRTPLPSGTACHVRIRLEGADIEISAHGRVVRQEANGCAVEFDELIGVESLEHLRNVVIYNTEDLPLVEEELRTHIGIKRR